MEQTPSIGRIVHYQQHGEPREAPDTEPFAALITQVFEDGSCQLCVVSRNGRDLNRCDFAGDGRPVAGHWNWPPKV